MTDRVVNARRLGDGDTLIEFLESGVARIRSSPHTQVRIVHLPPEALADLADVLDNDRPFLFAGDGRGDLP